MSDSWLGPWQPDVTDGPGADEKGLQQLIAACACESFDDMYGQVMNPTANAFENAFLDTQPCGDILAADEASSPSNALGNQDPTYDLFELEPGVSPHLISDTDMDDLIKMYTNKQSADPDDDTACREDVTSGGSACAYPTPLLSPEPDNVDLGSGITTVLGCLESVQRQLESIQETVDSQSRKLQAISRALSQLGDDSCESMAESARWRSNHEEWTTGVTMTLSYLVERKEREGN